MKNRKVFGVDLQGAKCTICVLCLGFLNTTIYLLFNEISRDDGTW